MEKMIFRTDRTTLTEGEVIEVEWNCSMAERVELTIDNGFKATNIPLDLAGTKKFRLNRSKGKTRLTITAWIGGKSYSNTIKVRVNPIPVTRAETVDGKGRRVGAKGDVWGNLLTKCQMFFSRFRSNWRQMPQRKHDASVILLALAAVVLLARIHPMFLLLGIMAVMAYLLWIVLKK